MTISPIVLRQILPTNLGVKTNLDASFVTYPGIRRGLFFFCNVRNVSMFELSNVKLTHLFFYLVAVMTFGMQVAVQSFFTPTSQIRSTGTFLEMFRGD